MTQFIAGRSSPNPSKGGETLRLFTENEEAERTTPLVFSAEAKAVFDAGRNLWKYYHAQFPSSGGVAAGRGGYNVNASFYDIRAHFQGRNPKGRMNARSEDETYTELITDLRNALKILAEKITPKIYEYEFLKA